MLWNEDAIKEIESVIETLPKLENDKWPFLPRDIFALSKPISEKANSVQISYSSAMIHFSMSVKQMDEDLHEWINKFEQFFKRIPDVFEANVDVFLPPYTGCYKNEHLNYHWKAIRDEAGLINWEYKGDPTKLDEICNPVYFSHSYFTEELRNQVVTNMQWLGSQVGNIISITDRITTSKGNYDRHFTRTNRLRTKLALSTF